MGQNECPLCGNAAERGCDSGSPDTIWYTCSLCERFVLTGWDENNIRRNTHERSKWHPERIADVLRERCLQRLDTGMHPVPALRFQRGQQYPEIPGTVGVWVDELLAEYPQTIPERIERSFCALARSKGEETYIGYRIHVGADNYSEFLLFAHDWQQARYFLDAMVQYKWLAGKVDEEAADVLVAPDGWRHYDEVTRTTGSALSPVFVAMWFGGTERKDEMTSLFEASLEAACKGLGWRSARADTPEHNEAIMDWIVAQIRAAPFVIAELSENNPGVYFEAGFARGLGKDVIYCCPEGQKVHFDLSAVRHVKWKDPDDLRERLTNRIVGTQGQGPHDFER